MKNTANIEDLETAFKYKSNLELRFTYYVYRLLQFPRLLRMFTKLTNLVIKRDLPVKFLIKKTVFKIFCAGENLDEAFDLVKKLDGYAVHSVLDYVSEGEKTRGAFERNTRIIIRNISQLGQQAAGNFISVKISGLEDPDFLKQVNASNYRALFESDTRLRDLVHRVDLICGAAQRYGVIVFIDAEDYFMQATLDHLTELMMEKYNRKEAIVYNTLQMYLKDRPGYIEHLISRGEEKKYSPGVKLVRGAYVEKEREHAMHEGKASPVYDHKDETDNAFNNGVKRCLDNYPAVRTCIATHNDHSTAVAIEYIEKKGIDPNKVMFSQLFGMSDNLTFNLAAKGYNASKYLPYGEVKKAIPYLIRRAEENSSMNGQVSREALRLKQEIIRRRKGNKIKA
jgi:proline dehydrogenase